MQVVLATNESDELIGFVMGCLKHRLLTQWVCKCGTCMESRNDAITLDRVLVALDELDQCARCVGVVLPCPPLWQGKFMTNHECFKRLIDGQTQQDVCVSLWLTHVVSFLFLLGKLTPLGTLDRYANSYQIFN